MENSTSTQPSSRRHLPFILWVIVFLLVFPCICRYTDGLLPRNGYWAIESLTELERVRKELSLAEARWKLHNITDFEINANAFTPPIFCYPLRDEAFSGWNLKVIQDEIVFDNAIQKSYIESCNVADFLPPKVFDTIRQILKTANPFENYLRVDFDPVYGYVSKYVSDYVWYPGTVCADCRTVYTFSDFRPRKP